MSVVKVYCKIETSPWALTLTEPVPEAFELPASDCFCGQSAQISTGSPESQQHSGSQIIRICMEIYLKIDKAVKMYKNSY